MNAKTTKTTRKTKTTANDQVAANDACPRCSERDPDQLVWKDDTTVHCHNCGTEYAPGHTQTPTRDACYHIRLIAKTQSRIHELMERTAAEWNRLQTEMSENAATVRMLIARSGADANAVVETIRRERVNTGVLESRLVDLLQEKAKTRFTSDGCIRTNWVVIENNF